MLSFCNIQTWGCRVPVGAFSRILNHIRCSRVVRTVVQSRAGQSSICLVYNWLICSVLACFWNIFSNFIVYFFWTYVFGFGNRIRFFLVFDLDCVYLASVHLPFCYWYISAHTVYPSALPESAVLHIQNEWMIHLYSALLCIAVHPKRFTII